MSSYDQGYTCIECEHSYDDRDGDLDERMCFECLDKIYEQEKKETVSGEHCDERRSLDIERAIVSQHYPDWSKKRQTYLKPIKRK